MRVSILALSFSLLIASALAASSSEIQALNDFYQSTNGPFWYNSKNWGVGDPCSNKWFGTSCNSNGNVASIVLESNSIRGTFPPSFANLTSLTELNLYYNQLYGDFPECLTSLANLSLLDLSSNSLTGSIPSSVSNMAHLTSFNLGSNRLTGTVPPSFANITSLQELSLYHNELGGAFPVEILNSLSANGIKIDLSNNILTEFDWASWTQTATTGNIVLTLTQNLLKGNLTEQIYWPKSISLNNNFFTGTIPDRTSVSFSSLARLNLNGNFLTGSVPASITTNTLLVNVDIGYNTKLTGELPAQIASMPYLETFLFYNTALTCPQDSQWDSFEAHVSTSCPYHYNYSSYDHYTNPWVWITIGYISAILFVICLVSVIVFFATRKRRVVVIAN